ncbi:hypothetical protein ACOSP7_024423 [Xanthoceras sorbifolium]
MIPLPLSTSSPILESTPNPAKKKYKVIDAEAPEPDINVSFPRGLQLFRTHSHCYTGSTSSSFPKMLLDWGISKVIYLHLKKELVSSIRKLRDFRELNSSLRKENDSLKLSEARVKWLSKRAQLKSRKSLDIWQSYKKPRKS